MKSMNDLSRLVVTRWIAASRDPGGGAGLYCVVGPIEKIFGHSHPVFATGIAIICLAPGVTDHRREAWTLVLEVATGFLVGEKVLWSGGDPLLQLAVDLFVSMMVASAFGLGPVVPIQAGVSTLLALTLGGDTAGLVRMIDVLIGAVVGLIVNRLLLLRLARQRVDRAGAPTLGT